MSKLVIKKHRPLHVFFTCLILSSLISGAVWLSLNTVHWYAIKSLLTDGQRVKTLWRTNQDLDGENQALRERIMMLERLAKLDEAAADRLQDEIKKLQDQIYNLTGELEFYQGVMSSTTNSKGLNIHGLNVVETDQQSFYHYKAILTNVAKSNRAIEVIFDMSIEGINDSGAQILSLKEVESGSATDHTISFTNFERIEGGFLLPAGFKPLRVVVSLKQKGVAKSTVQRIFEWSTIAG